MTPIDIQRLRHGLGWTQAQLANHVGVSQPLVSAWERGHRVPSSPALKLLGQLARELEWGEDSGPSRVDMVSVLLEQLAKQQAQEVDLSPLQDHSPPRTEGVETYVSTKRALTLGLFEAFEQTLMADLHERASRLSPATHPHPLLSAYLEQATGMLHDAPPASQQRAALIVALTSQPDVVEALRGWYEQTIEQLLPQDHPQRDALSLILLGVDALWLFSLLGLTTFEETYARRMSDAARALMGSLGVHV